MPKRMIVVNRRPCVAHVTVSKQTGHATASSADLPGDVAVADSIEEACDHLAHAAALRLGGGVGGWQARAA